MARCRCCSAPSRTARATRPAIRRSPPTCWPADRGVPLCPGRYARGQERQRAWRGAVDAYGRRGACRRAAVVAKGRAVAAHLLQADPGDDRFAAGRSRCGTASAASTCSRSPRAAADPANLPDGMAPGSTAMSSTAPTCSPSPMAAMSPRSRSTPKPALVTLRALHRGRRLRPADQPVDHRRPGPGRGDAGHRPGDAGAHRLRSGIGAVAERLAHGLRAAAGRRSSRLRHHLGGAADPANPLGVKGSGQAGCIAAPQTIVNAILDALSPLGIEQIDMPATPESVWRAIRGRGGS